jgi:hypothetical protein
MPSTSETWVEIGGFGVGFRVGDGVCVHVGVCVDVGAQALSANNMEMIKKEPNLHLYIFSVLPV